MSELDQAGELATLERVVERFIQPEDDMRTPPVVCSTIFVPWRNDE
jgi:hypothetical protein